MAFRNSVLHKLGNGIPPKLVDALPRLWISSGLRAQDYVRSVDPYLDLQWEDYLSVFEAYPRLMHGETEEAEEAE